MTQEKPPAAALGLRLPMRTVGSRVKRGRLLKGGDLKGRVRNEEERKSRIYAVTVRLVVDCYQLMMELICSIFLQYDFFPLDQKCMRASLVAQLVKNLPSMQETPI